MDTDFVGVQVNRCTVASRLFVATNGTAGSTMFVAIDPPQLL
jgi:hypothetical protein